MGDGIDLGEVEQVLIRRGQPLAEVEPGGKVAGTDKPGPLATALGNELALICTKVAPTMSTEQAGAWIRVMVVALANLPGRSAIQATRRALGEVIRFLPDAEAIIRTEAARIEARRTLALRRLRQMRAAEAPPTPAAIEVNGEAAVLDPAKVRALPRHLIDLGLSAGFITPEQLEPAGAAATLPLDI